MPPPLPLVTRVDTAGELVVRARIFYDIWRYYEDAETRPAILPTMNAYPDFFRFDTHAHFVSFTVYMAGLVERRTDTTNLSHLTAECEASGTVSVAALGSAKAALSRTEPIRPKVVILRNNLFAHRSASLSYEEAFRIASVTPNQLRDLTVDALDVANSLLVGCGGQRKWFHERPLEHAKKMLRKIGPQRAT